MAVLVVALGALFAQYHQTQENWKQLKTIDDQKIAVDMKALTACVDGWTATTEINLSGIDKATSDLNASRKTNTNLLDQRKSALDKLGY